MKITRIETVTVSAGWKNWLLLKVHTDAGMHGIGEGTLNGFIKTTEAAVLELEHLALGRDPRQVNQLSKHLMDSVSLDGGHIDCSFPDLELESAGVQQAGFELVGHHCKTHVPTSAALRALPATLAHPIVDPIDCLSRSETHGQ